MFSVYSPLRGRSLFGLPPVRVFGGSTAILLWRPPPPPPSAAVNIPLFAAPLLPTCLHHARVDFPLESPFQFRFGSRIYFAFFFSLLRISGFHVGRQTSPGLYVRLLELPSPSITRSPFTTLSVAPAAAHSTFSY